MIPGRQLAFAALMALAALLFPERALAAILPVCDAGPVWTTIPTPPEPSCEVITTVDDETGETTKAAPICDPRGASAVAPPRIMPIEDSRLEASACKSVDDRLFGVSPDRQDAPVSSAWTLPYAAPLDEAPRVPPSPESDDAGALPTAGAARAGVLREIYHPPR